MEARSASDICSNPEAICVLVWPCKRFVNISSSAPFHSNKSIQADYRRTSMTSRRPRGSLHPDLKNIPLRDALVVQQAAH
jgi:hypothetical protein